MHTSRTSESSLSSAATEMECSSSPAQHCEDQREEQGLGTSSCCWICFESEDQQGELLAPCRCSRKAQRFAHRRCLARWQLQNAGTRRERYCDFCGDALPDWRVAEGMSSPGAQAPAIMNVNFGGATYSFQVRPGPEGYAEFTRAIVAAFGLPSDAELNITFTCDEPCSGSLLTLQGAGAYDAAVHCAAVSAARRPPRDSSSLSSPSTRSETSDLTNHSPGVSQPGSPGSSLRPSRASSPRPERTETEEGAQQQDKAPVLSGLRRRLRDVFSDFF